MVVYSDETKINCIGSDGRTIVWKMAGEPLNDRLVEGTPKFSPYLHCHITPCHIFHGAHKAKPSHSVGLCFFYFIYLFPCK